MATVRVVDQEASSAAAATVRVAEQSVTTPRSVGVRVVDQEVVAPAGSSAVVRVTELEVTALTALGTVVYVLDDAEQWRTAALFILDGAWQAL